MRLLFARWSGNNSERNSWGDRPVRRLRGSYILGHRTGQHHHDSMNIRPILVFPLLSTLMSASAGQVPVEDHTIRLDVNLVVINVSVLKKNGDTVSGLGKQAFQLFVDDSPLPINVFH